MFYYIKQKKRVSIIFLVQCFVSAELTTIFCDNNDKVSSLLDRRKQFPCLKTIIIIDQMNEKNRNKAAEEGVRLLQLEDVEVSYQLIRTVRYPLSSLSQNLFDELMGKLFLSILPLTTSDTMFHFHSISALTLFLHRI